MSAAPNNGRTTEPLDLSEMPPGGIFGTFEMTAEARAQSDRDRARRERGEPLPDDGPPLVGRSRRRKATAAEESADAPNAAPSPELHAAALYGLAGEIVRTMRPHTEAADAAVLAHLLAVYGCAVGPGPYYAVGASPHRARLFTLVVGSTGRGRKGTALDAALAPFRHPDGPGGVLARIRSNVQSGEAIVEAVRDGEGDDPGVDDKRLLDVETEFGNVLATKGRSGSILSGVMRQAWDSDTLFNTKVRPVRATGSHVVFIGHITAEELLRDAGKTDVSNGFLNRFLFVHSEQARSLPMPEPPPDAALARLARALSDAVDEASHRGRVALSPAGVAAWKRLYPHLDADDEGAVGAMLARVKPYVLRLALVYALLDRAAYVEPVHLRAAAAVLDYHTATVRRVYGTRAGQTLPDRILDAVRANGGEATKTELHTSLQRHATAAALDAALATLERLGAVERGRRPGKGRTAETVRMCVGSEGRVGDAGGLPTLLSQFAPLADAEPRRYVSPSDPLADGSTPPAEPSAADPF